MTDEQKDALEELKHAALKMNQEYNPGTVYAFETALASAQIICSEEQITQTREELLQELTKGENHENLGI